MNSPNLIVSRLLLAATCAGIVCASATLSGCSLFKRSNNAENTESETHVLKTPNSAAAEANTDPRELLAKRAFDRAKLEYDKENFANAAVEFDRYLNDYPGVLGATTEEKAYYLLGTSYFKTGQHEKALPHLKRTAENSRTTDVTGEALLMTGESLLKLGRADEAMAVTFELLPDASLERRLGVKPEWKLTRGNRVRTLLKHQVRAYLLRAKAAAVQAQGEPSLLATESLRKGKRLLEDATGLGIPATEAPQLKADFALGELEMHKLKCEQIAAPAKISEEIFADFTEQYYRCVDGAKPLLCELYATSIISHRKPAGLIYKDMILRPAALATDMPPPARALKDQTTRQHFEIEMKDYILKSVDQRLEDNRSLDECGWLGLY